MTKAASNTPTGWRVLTSDAGAESARDMYASAILARRAILDGTDAEVIALDASGAPIHVRTLTPADMVRDGSDAATQVGRLSRLLGAAYGELPEQAPMITVSLPGIFADYLEGTGAGQGTDTGSGARLGEIYAAGLWQRRTLVLSFRQSDADALTYLAELAELATEFTGETALIRSGRVAVERVRAALAELPEPAVIGSTEVEESAPVDVLIDREGLDPGHALIYCAADARMDGRLGSLGHEGRRIYIETYGLDRDGAETGEPVSVSASSAERAVRKLAKVLGITLGTITTER